MAESKRSSAARMRWSRASLFVKILLPLSTVTLIAFVALSSLNYIVARDALRAEIFGAGKLAVSSFAQTNALEFLDAERGPLDLRLRLNKQVQSDSEHRLVDAYALNQQMQVIAAAQTSQQALQQWPMGSTAPFDKTMSEPTILEQQATVITIGAPVIYDGTTLGFIVFRFSNTAIADAGQRILGRSALIALGFVAFNALLAFVLLRLLLRPVAQLGLAATELARGNYHHRIELAESSDEIGQAAKSFNSMSDTIELHMRFSNAALVERIRHGGALIAQEHHLTVSFGDAVDYTRWSQQHTPAEVFKTLGRYYTCIGRLVVTRFDGVIDKFIGDGIMSHFGLPRHDQQRQIDLQSASVDQVRNALRAVVYSQIVLRVLAYSITHFAKKEALSYRFGVATGRCLVGALGARDLMLDYSLIGGVVNLASRLEHQSCAGGLAIDRFTHMDAGADFLDAVDAGQHKIKGIEQPVQVYSVRGFQQADEVAKMQRYLLDEFFNDELISEILLDGVGTGDQMRALRLAIESEVRDRPFLPT